MAFKTFADGAILDADDLNTYLMKQSVIVCTSGTRPSSPVTGMTIFETDSEIFRIYTGASWRRYGVKLGDIQPQQTSDATSMDVNSTSWAAGSPVVGLAFVAPPSGYVYVTISAYLTASHSGDETRLSFELKTGATIGSGTASIATSSVRSITAGAAVSAGGVSIASGSYRQLCGPFTVAADYNVRTMHQSNAVYGGGSAAGTITYRHLLIEPVL